MRDMYDPLMSRTGKNRQRQANLSRITNVSVVAGTCGEKVDKVEAQSWPQHVPCSLEHVNAFLTGVRASRAREKLHGNIFA